MRAALISIIQILAVCLLPTLLFADSNGLNSARLPRLGKPADPAVVAINDTLVFPDGTGLPAGSGSVTDGATLYVQHCLLCHGANGRGGSGQELSGGIADLTHQPPDQTIGTYWPYATTLFDFIRRAMPMHRPGILSNAEVYALTAYLLFENGVVPENTVLDKTSLVAVKMPNREGFRWIDVNVDGKLTTSKQAP